MLLVVTAVLDGSIQVQVGTHKLHDLPHFPTAAVVTVASKHIFSKMKDSRTKKAGCEPEPAFLGERTPIQVGTHVSR